jgi:tungstate transport system substrate-binding protein
VSLGVGPALAERADAEGTIMTTTYAAAVARVLASVTCLLTAALGFEATAQGELVRLEVVPTVEQSGVLGDVLRDFEKESGYRVQIHSGSTDLFDRARRGLADLVISHYGFADLERFVQDGYGFWPRAVFFNQSAILGPPSDPAQIRGATDAFEAFRRIAKARAPFITNNLPTLTYLVDLLWEGAGRPDRTDWFFDLGLEAQEAVLAAAKNGAYTVWGVDPFVRLISHRQIEEEMLCVADPVLQRIMVSVVVNPEAVEGVNAEGAQALQQYLLKPATQARIRAVRYEGFDSQFWWPAGTQN